MRYVILILIVLIFIGAAYFYLPDVKEQLSSKRKKKTGSKKIELEPDMESDEEDETDELETFQKLLKPKEF